MANYNRYMYETSPRKLKPEYIPPKEKKRGKSSVLKQKENIQVKKKELIKKRKAKAIMYLIIVFAVLFAIGYQNSKINEEFSAYKDSEAKLSAIQKENEQLKVTIENNLSLSNIEQMAKEQLGMQKASTQQTRYINLPKKDYVEVASEQIIRNTNSNLLENILNRIKNIVE